MFRSKVVLVEHLKVKGFQVNLEQKVAGSQDVSMNSGGYDSFQKNAYIRIC